MNLIIIIRKTETFYLNIFTLDDTFAVAEQRNVKIAKKRKAVLDVENYPIIHRPDLITNLLHRRHRIRVY